MLPLVLLGLGVVSGPWLLESRAVGPHIPREPGHTVLLTVYPRQAFGPGLIGPVEVGVPVPDAALDDVVTRPPAHLTDCSWGAGGFSVFVCFCLSGGV